MSEDLTINNRFLSRTRGDCRKWIVILSIVAVWFVIPLALIVGKIYLDPAIEFLTPSTYAQWAMWFDPANNDFWKDTQTGTARYQCDFRRNSAEEHPVLSIKAFTKPRVVLNGKHIEPIKPTTNWKRAVRFDLGPALRPEGNHLLVEVTNEGSFPALLVESPDFLRTPDNWRVSMSPESASEHPAVAPLTGVSWPGVMQQIPQWRRIKWVVVSWLVLCTGITAWVLVKWRRDAYQQPLIDQSMERQRQWGVAGVVVVIASLALNLSNAHHYESGHGPDTSGHIDHIRQIAGTWIPRLAPDGWQTYQPPLYYYVAAVVYRIAGGDASPLIALKYVQYLSVASGVALVLVAWFYIKYLLPNKPAIQFAALVFVAFLPVSLCVNVLCNNEGFTAVVISAVFIFMIRQFEKTHHEVGLRPIQGFWLGLLVGLAMLTKFSALFLVVLGGLILVRRSMIGGGGERCWRPVFAFLAGVGLVCGWYYARNIHHFGEPFYGNWQSDPDDGAPSFRTMGFYLHFGNAFFQHPVASSWTGWADGLYAGLWTGDARFYFPDWMTQAQFLLAVILLLALPPSLAIAVGMLKTIRSALRQPDTPTGGTDLLLATMTIWSLLAHLWFSIRVPANGTITARYLLYLVPVFAIFLGRGIDVLSRSARWARYLLYTDFVCLMALIMIVYRFGIFRQ